jgi:hypothetical protein
MGGRWMSAFLVVSVGCATAKVAPATGPAQAPIAETGRKYVDPQLGFEIVRPTNDWEMELSDELTPEGVAIPIVLRHKETGAQVVLQVVPAVASPTQYARRLTDGLKSHAGFTTTDLEPLPLSDNAVGFHFSLGDKVMGRVAVREGNTGHVLMMLATWPHDAPSAVPDRVQQIFDSIQPVPAG